MDFIVNNELVIGAAAAAVLIGAVLASSLFRNLALAASALALAWLYAQQGVDGLMAIGQSLSGDLAARPDFARGLLIGTALAAVILGAALVRRRPS